MADNSPTEDNLVTPLLLDDSNNPIAQLNNEFYAKYDEDYFVNKAVVLASLIADSIPLKGQLGKGFTVGKLTVKDANIDNDWIEGYAKRELTINSYHAIESFFRLFFAHVEEPECPWIGVEQMQSFWKFKSKVEQLVAGEYFDGDHGEAVVKLLFGSRESYDAISDKEWKKGIDNVTHILLRLGLDILNNQDYNVYKHGAALLDTQYGFTIDDGKILGADKQDAFMYLSSQREETPEKIVKKFSKTHKFVRWEQRFVNTYLCGMLLHNMLALHKSRLGIPQPKDTKVYSFHNIELKNFFDFDNGDRVALPDSMSIGIFERHYVNKKKNKKDKAR